MCQMVRHPNNTVSDLRWLYGGFFKLDAVVGKHEAEPDEQIGEGRSRWTVCQYIILYFIPRWHGGTNGLLGYLDVCVLFLY